MKRLNYLIISLLLPLLVQAQSTSELYRKYIEQYKKEAQAQQKKHGIPASITLAQGLLESGAGRSELAVKANNHFGVKCAGGWEGETYRHDDETRQECFRKYKHAEESYEDHSLFLLRPRYKELFDLKVTDYKGWAHGLKKCGYATDPGYAGKLIKIIEDYDLAQYDKQTKAKSENEKDKNSSIVSDGADVAADKPSATEETKNTDKQDRPNQPKSPKSPRSQKSPKPIRTKPQTAETQQTAPLTVEEEKVEQHYERVRMRSTNLTTEHPVFRCNGKKFIVAHAGDTFESIAMEYNIYEQTLRSYNDIMNPKYQLQEGDKIYLQRKRKYAEKRFKHYRVHKDENIWQIAQDKGMQLNTIYDLNGIERGQNVMVNQFLYLRK